MEQFSRNTPTTLKKGWTSMMLNRSFAESDASITLNGVTYTNASLAILRDRFLFYAFADAGGPGGRTSTQWGLSLPADYKSGTDIQIRNIWTTSLAGNAMWRIALCKKVSGALVGDTGTEFQEVVQTATTTGVFDAQYTDTLTFDGSTLSPNDEISICVSRDSGDALDTISGTIYLSLIVLYYEMESLDDLHTDTDFKIMTPLEHKTIFEDFYFDGWMTVGDAGTFNTVVCTATDTITLNDKWKARQFWDGFNDVATFAFCIPVDYKTGEDIKIEIDWTPLVATGGNVEFNAGYCRTVKDGAFGSETETQYLSPTVVAAPTVINERIQTSFIFDGSNVSADDIGCFIIYRNTLEIGNSDTLAGNVGIVSLSIVIPRNIDTIETVV